jgi:hypothetical protein
MDTNASIVRASLSAGVFAATAYVVSGGRAGSMDYATEAVIQGIAAVASDVAHAWASMNPTWMTSGAGTGAVAAGIKYFWRNDPALFTNFAMSAVVDGLTDTTGAMLWPSSAAVPPA